MIYTPEASLDYPANATLTQILLDRNLDDTPADKPAIIDGVSGKVAYTYRSFRDGVKKLAVHLRGTLKIERGMTIGILMTNTVHYPLLVHAILACGATVSALNPAYQPTELAHVLSLAQPCLVFVDQNLVKRLEQAVDASSAHSPRPLIHVVSRDEFDIEKNPRKTDASGPNRLALYAKKAADDVAFICFSSGTTGTVKGVKLSHRNMVANMFQHRQGLQGDFDEDSVFVLVLPFFHILGLGVFACQYVLQGYPIVVFPRLDFAGLVRSIKRDKSWKTLLLFYFQVLTVAVTHINVVPTLALEFLRNPIAAKGDYSTVKCLMNAAAPLKQDLSDQVSKRLGCVITQWYGMTEASPSVISQAQNQLHVPNSIGKLLPGIDMRILDGNEKDCLTQVSGELCVRGPNIMQGYIGPKELTSNAMTSEGFMRTGDIGYVDSEGFVYLVDRAKEMIKVKGHQVAPAELETILLSHPLVKDAAVKGFYSDHEASEVPVGYIATGIAHSEQAALISELQQLVEMQVAKYKRISGGIHVISEIPRNASGKVLRRLLPEVAFDQDVSIMRRSRL